MRYTYPLLPYKHSPSSYVLSSVYRTILDFAVNAFYAVLCNSVFEQKIDIRRSLLDSCASNVLIHPNGSIEKCIPLLGTTPRSKRTLEEFAARGDRPLHPATTFQIQRMEERIKGGWSIRWINGSNLRINGESKRQQAQDKFTKGKRERAIT